MCALKAYGFTNILNLQGTELRSLDYSCYADQNNWMSASPVLILELGLHADES